MKVSTVNLVCWCASGVFVLGLFGFLLQHKGRSSKVLENPTFAKSVLEQGGGTVTPLGGPSTDYQGEVVPIWHTMNWTGFEPPDAPPPPPRRDIVVVRKGVKDLLSIIFIQVDTDDPGGSVIRVRYRGDLVSEGDGQLVVGDTLPGAFSYAAVHKINPESVEFAFTIQEGETEAIENEIVDAIDGSRTPIRSVIDGNIIKPPRTGLPQRANKPKPKTETREITPNLWQLGSEDVGAFADDYQRILTQDVRTRTHYDANGKRAGIEITEVKAGSIAARHGAKEGDIVISINGHGVSSEQEAIKYVKNNSDTTSVWEVVIENMGRTSTRVYRSPED
jgi:type II secretory pathway component PulC